ncbi:MAG TPA: ABC transporter permease [Candidatus Acidoferrales bacterium]|jgi:peptide/nickel transport system permease protein|nr:ABC transporter permease [Candidatus Acidoferrales bacterium]
MAAPSLPVGTALLDEELQYSKVTFWTRLRRHKLAVTGLAVLALMVLAAIFAKQLAPFDPNAIDNVHWQGMPLPPCFQDASQCGGHALGTDEVGRDLLSRLLFGARVSLTVGLFAVIMEVLIGATLGAIAGYYGGWVDFALMRLTDVFLSIPLLPLLLVLTAIVAASSSRASLSFGVIVIIIGALSWPTVARLVRASFLSLREREFAEAARAVGNNDGRIIFLHLLPNAVAPIVVQATLDVAGVIITESTLSFLGLGIQPPTASWGNMLANAAANLQTAWWAAVFPGLCILVTVLAINYIGDGLRDALDPKLG